MAEKKRRTMWRANIAFGKIKIPVRMYSAVKEERVHFRMLHAKDKTPLQQQMVCSVDGETVGLEHMVKGFPIDEEHFLRLEQEELSALEPETSRDIEALEVVPLGEMDPRFFERPYYLGPDGDDALYAAFNTTLAEAGNAVICRWVMRKQEYLGAIKPSDGVLQIETLRQAAEVVEVKSLDLPTVKLNQRELKTADYLVQTMSAEFKPEEYHNEHQELLRDMIAKKVRGEKIRLHKPKKKAATPEKNLIAVLEESVKQAKARKAG